MILASKSVEPAAFVFPHSSLDAVAHADIKSSGAAAYDIDPILLAIICHFLPHVILSEVFVRVANENAVEGPHACRNCIRLGQEFSDQKPVYKSLAQPLPLLTGMWSFDFVAASHSRSSNSAQDDQMYSE